MRRGIPQKALLPVPPFASRYTLTASAQFLNCSKRANTVGFDPR